MRAFVIADRRDDQGDVSELIELYTACVHFHSLPESGGILDQRARTMYLLNMTQFAFDERKALEEKRQQQKMPRR